MNHPETHDRGAATEAKLPRRDWILLPMLGLLTVCLMVAATELIARRLFSYSRTSLTDCTKLDAPSDTTTYIPNCVCWEKAMENRPIQYRFNSSGYRSDVDFGPKRPGTYRIVMVGSSTGMGYQVPIDKSLAVLLPKELSRRTGRPVELLNEAVLTNKSALVLPFREALALDPDMVIWMLTPVDLEHGIAVVHHPEKADTRVHFMKRAWSRVKLAFTSGSGLSAIDKIFDQTRTSELLRHYLSESQSQFLQSYLMNGDSQVGFLEAAPSPKWKEDLRQFSEVAADFRHKRMPPACLWWS